MANPLSLLDAAALEQKPLRKAVLMAMFKGRLPSPIDYIPTEGATSLSQQVVRITDAGSPSTRHIGDTVAAYAAKFGDRGETLKVIENKITIDKVLLEIKTYIQDPIALQIRSYGEAVRAFLNNLLVNGDPTTDATQPQGMTFRLNNDAMFSGQSINANGQDVSLGGGATDIQRHQLFLWHDQAISLVNGGKASCIVMNRQAWITWRANLRYLKLYELTRDAFDREFMVYSDCKLLDAGLTPAGLTVGYGTVGAGFPTVQIIGNNNTTSIFGTASTTPSYVINTEGEEGVKILQLFAMRVQRIGIDPSNPGSYVVDVTWPVGFLFPTRFCLSSVQGLKF